MTIYIYIYPHYFCCYNLSCLAEILVQSRWDLWLTITERFLLLFTGQCERKAGPERWSCALQHRQQHWAEKRLEYHPSWGNLCEVMIMLSILEIFSNVHSSIWNLIYCCPPTVEVLWSNRVHRLARGSERKGGPRPLLSRALSGVWPQLHQHVLDTGEWTPAVKPMTNVAVIPQTINCLDMWSELYLYCISNVRLSILIILILNTFGLLILYSLKNISESRQDERKD